MDGAPTHACTPSGIGGPDHCGVCGRTFEADELAAEPEETPEPTMADTTMSLAEVYEDLVGVHEIATKLGVKVHRVRRWIERRETTGCPSPVCKIGVGSVYSMNDWRGWFALWRITRGTWGNMPESKNR